VSQPSLKLPLPPDPGNIAAGRASGAFLDDPELSYARFKNLLEDPSLTVDGLQYVHGALGQLVYVAAELLAIAPLTPEMPVWTDADIIDFKIVTTDGDHLSRA
jgi:hypothetical protein